ncbi:MAG: F0F1 ATP synthase subunit gamma [Bacteroidales bacterium]|nr:F0F1 ATP synthase subunit gamma [Bacteroidales bacterium]
MPTLREIKSRIGAVRSTLKITGAMKLVASTKLQKAQRKVTAMLPYSQALHDMLRSLSVPPEYLRSGSAAPDVPNGQAVPDGHAVPDGADVSNGRTAVVGSETKAGRTAVVGSETKAGRTAVVAVASNNALCGAFNHNVIDVTMDEISKLGPGVEPFAIGKKMEEALHRAGRDFMVIHHELSGDPSYEDAAALSDQLTDGFLGGRFDRVLLIYTHFNSAGSQIVRTEQFLPLSAEPGTLRQTAAGQTLRPGSAGQSGAAGEAGSTRADEPGSAGSDEQWIMEPDAAGLAQRLIPKVLRAGIYAVLLDSAAAEHAARTVAMQAATENAETLIDELTLQYNKSRQQKITAEILDLSR